MCLVGMPMKRYSAFMTNTTPEFACFARRKPVNTSNVKVTFLRRRVTPALALALILSFAASTASLPFASGHVPPQSVPTNTYIAVSPNPVGVGQQAIITGWVNPAPPTATTDGGDRWQGLTVTIVRPDGTQETLGPFRSNSTGAVYLFYTPTQCGMYSLTFRFSGQVLHLSASVFGTPGVESEYVNDTFLPSMSAPLTLSVQQQPVGLSPSPTPTPQPSYAPPSSTPNPVTTPTPAPVSWCSLGVPYKGSDGLTVTVNKIIVVEKVGSYQYIVNYALKNENPNSTIAEGEFRVIDHNGVAGAGMSGFFYDMFPGDVFQRSYTFEELKPHFSDMLQYTGIQGGGDYLTWKIEAPSNVSSPSPSSTPTPLPVAYGQIGIFYNASDGLSVRVDSLQVLEKDGVHKYIINYTLKNENWDKAIPEGWFWIKNSSNTVCVSQGGIFGRMAPGDELSKSYQFLPGTDVYEEIQYYPSDPNGSSYLSWKILNETNAASGLLTPTVNVICKTTASYSNFRVDITGSLTCNGTSLQNAPILLSYSVNGGNSWSDLTRAFTDTSGAFSAVWLPSVTGDNLLRATFAGNSTYAAASTVVDFAVAAPDNQKVFSVTSNSTLSSLAFNSTDESLSFTVSGPTGTTGYVELSVPNSLVSDVSQLKVLLDGNQLSYSFQLQGDSWIVSFIYHHSTHQVKVNFGAAAANAFPTLQIPAAVWAILPLATAVVFTMFLIKRKR